MDNDHQWYLVTLVFKVEYSMAVQRPQYQEQCRLVLAGNERAAVAKAKAVLTAEGAAVVATLSLGICWHFEGIAAVTPLTEAWDGAELYANQYGLTNDAKDHRQLQMLSA